MLKFAIRRALWAIPALLLISIASFFVLSFVPDTTDDPRLVAELGKHEVDRIRRERFLDLPRFLNFAPKDVRVRATESVLTIAAGGAASAAAGQELARLGGAALPFVLPMLDALSPDPRARVALALAPVADRMGIATNDARDPEHAVAFWARFWDDRAIEFRPAAVRTAVQRLVRYGSKSRTEQLQALDTFALADIFNSLEMPREPSELRAVRALTGVAAHMTGIDDALPEGADLESARECVARWRSWWRVHRSEYIQFAGVSRVSAIVIETRYGQWALGAVTGRLGLTVDGLPVLDELVARGPTTLAIVGGAIVLAYLIAIPLGLTLAMLPRRRTRRGIVLLVLSAYAVPVSLIAVLVSDKASGHELPLAVVLLAMGLLAGPTRQGQFALDGIRFRDFVRASTSKGGSAARSVAARARGHALMPLSTTALAELPLALGGAFVIERVFGLRGLGEATIRAVKLHDLGWLMTISLATAVFAAFAALCTDLLYAVIDRRVARGVFGRSP